MAVLKNFMGCNTWTEYVWLIVSKYDKFAPAWIITQQKRKYVFHTQGMLPVTPSGELIMS